MYKYETAKKNTKTTDYDFDQSDKLQFDDLF